MTSIYPHSQASRALAGATIPPTLDPTQSHQRSKRAVSPPTSSSIMHFTKTTSILRARPLGSIEPLPRLKCIMYQLSRPMGGLQEGLASIYSPLFNPQHRIPKSTPIPHRKHSNYHLIITAISLNILHSSTTPLHPHSLNPDQVTHPSHPNPPKICAAANAPLPPLNNTAATNVTIAANATPHSSCA